MTDPKPSSYSAQTHRHQQNDQQQQQHHHHHQHLNPSKIYTRLLFRGLFVAVVLLLLPHFPSQAPDFFNQSLLTRSWELLHLLFVGIAVCYGLFSRRNLHHNDKDVAVNHPKLDPTSPHSSLSRLLDISSVFDDDDLNADSPSRQTWNAQYHPQQPTVMLANEKPALSANTRRLASNRPLLLPIRSLKPAINDSASSPSPPEMDQSSLCGDAADSNSEDLSRLRNGEFRSLSFQERSTESVVLPCPIPWRSHSGGLEFREEISPENSSEFDAFDSPSLKCPPVHCSPRPALSPSPKRLSPSPSLSPEFRGKSGEDSMKRKALHKEPTTPSPPLPLPPAPIHTKSLPHERSSGLVEGEFVLDEKKLRRRSKSDVKELSRGRQDLSPNKDHSFDSFRLEMKLKSRVEARNFKSDVKELSRGTGEDLLTNKDQSFDSFGLEMRLKNRPEGQNFKSGVKESTRSGREDLLKNENQGFDSFRLEMKPKIRHEPIGKSVRTIRTGEIGLEGRRGRDNGVGTEISSGRKHRELDSLEGEISDGRKYREVDSLGSEKAATKSQLQPSVEKRSCSVHFPPPKYQMREMAEEIIEEDDCSDSGESQRNSNGEVSASASSVEVGNDANEVDIKAEEFIAKFREQIRLQRIESIKRCSGQHSSIKSR